MNNMKYNVQRTHTQENNVKELSYNLSNEVYSNRLTERRDYSKLRLKASKL